MWIVRIASKNRWTSLVNYIWQSVSNSPCKCEHNGELHSWVRWNVKLLLSPASSCLYNVQWTLVYSVQLQVPLHPAADCTMYSVHCTVYSCMCPASSCLYMTSLTLVTSNIYMQVPPAYSCLYNVHCTLYTIQLQVPCIQLPVHDKGDTSKLKLTRVTL